MILAKIEAVILRHIEIGRVGLRGVKECASALHAAWELEKTRDNKIWNNTVMEANERTGAENNAA